ncbi:TetR/AcrR family transcriptional regulator [Streptomyces sp. NPDC004749]
MDPVRTSADASPARTGTPPTPACDAGERAAPDPRALRRERLFATATELFTERGYWATSIERICATARISVRAFYEEFESREGLLIALHNEVARAGMEAALTVLSDPAMESAATRERITALGHAFVDAVTADPAATRIAFVDIVGAGRPVDDHRLLWRTLWAEFLTGEAERAVARGEAAERDHTLAMVALIGAANELVGHWARHSPALPKEVLTAELVRHALATFGVSAGDTTTGAAGARATATHASAGPVTGPVTGTAAGPDGLDARAPGGEGKETR